MCVVLTATFFFFWIFFFISVSGRIEDRLYWLLFFIFTFISVRTRFRVQVIYYFEYFTCCVQLAAKHKIFRSSITKYFNDTRSVYCNVYLPAQWLWNGTDNAISISQISRFDVFAAINGNRQNMIPRRKQTAEKFPRTNRPIVSAKFGPKYIIFGILYPNVTTYHTIIWPNFYLY